MSKKIIYWVQRYKPSHEAISKEIKVLVNFFSIINKVSIFDLHFDGFLNFKFKKKIFSHHFIYYPFTFFLAKLLNRKNDISHIYTSLGDFPYLHILRKKPIILTAAAPCSETKLRKRIKFLKKLNKIIVENESDRDLLIKNGINGKLIEIIYPSVDIYIFSYQKTKNKKFKILLTSTPERTNDFEKRGINLIMNCAKNSKDVVFDIPWRYKNYTDARNIVEKMNIDNVKIYFSIIKDMNVKFSEVDCIIVPYTKKDIFLKQIPNSAIESLAAGKPVLCSNRIELAKIIKNENCGVVFEPDLEGLNKAIKELRNNYEKYQKNCRKTAKKYFSKKTFIKKYEEIYSNLVK